MPYSEVIFLSDIISSIGPTISDCDTYLIQELQRLSYKSLLYIITWLKIHYNGIRNVEVVHSTNLYTYDYVDISMANRLIDISMADRPTYSQPTQ